MAFFDLSIVGSDTASDFAALVRASSRTKAVGLLLPECKRDHGRYNTPGFANVALVLLSRDGARLWKDRRTLPLAAKLVAAFEKIRREVTFGAEARDIEGQLNALGARFAKRYRRERVARGQSPNLRPRKARKA